MPGGRTQAGGQGTMERHQTGDSSWAWRSIWRREPMELFPCPGETRAPLGGGRQGERRQVQEHGVGLGADCTVWVRAWRAPTSETWERQGGKGSIGRGGGPFAAGRGGPPCSGLQSRNLHESHGSEDGAPSPSAGLRFSDPSGKSTFKWIFID